MAIKAIDKLIPAGDFSLIDFNDVDQNVETIVTAGSYDPGATPVNGSKYVIDMNPGTGGSNLHANFSSRLGADATNNLAQFDIIQYDSNAGVSGLFEIKFDASEKGEGNLIYVKDEDKYYFYTTTGGGD